MIYAWWLPKRDIDPLVKKQIKMTKNMLSLEHKVGKETANEFLQALKETQVEYGGIGIMCSDGQIHMLNEKKERKNDKGEHSSKKTK